jgi:hypothetical protein
MPEAHVNKPALERLDTDDTARAEFVEELRCAAALLDGSEPESLLDARIRTNISFKVACRLRDLAQQLCDHARTSSDGSCRYCEIRRRP